MNRSLIANRYARALFKLAIEQNNLEDINNNISMLQNYYNEVDGFADLINSPVIKPEQKRSALHAVLDKRFEETTIRFLDLLISNNREVLLEDINRAFITMFKTEKGIKLVTLYTANEIDDQQKEALETLLKNQLKSPVELELKVNPDILGGFKLTIDGKMADASMSSKLKAIKKQLLS